MKTLLIVACGLSALLASPGCLRWPRETDCALPSPPPAAEQAPPLPAQPGPATVLSPADRIRAALSRKRIKGLVWDEVNLDQAVAYLRTITGERFTISAKVREQRFGDVVISVQLDDVSVTDLLDAVLTEPYELRWDVRESVVWILTNEEVEERTFLRYYDVKDLLEGSVTQGVLLDRLCRAVHPAYWARDDATIEAHDGIFIVRASRPVLAAVDRYLAAERAARRR